MDTTSPIQGPFEHAYLWETIKAASSAITKFNKLFLGITPWPRSVAPREHFGDTTETPKYRIVEVTLTVEP